MTEEIYCSVRKRKKDNKLYLRSIQCHVLLLFKVLEGQCSLSPYLYKKIKMHLGLKADLLGSKISSISPQKRKNEVNFSMARNFQVREDVRG